MNWNMSHQLTADAITRGFQPARIGRRVLLFDEIGSTNAYCLQVVAADGPGTDGTVVFAEFQSAGRGRLGRKWDCPRGAGLMFTALIWESPERLSITRLMMATAVGVCRGIEATTDVETLIRWPNDIYVRDRKIAGILAEAQPRAEGAMPVAIGVGINCLQHAGHFPDEVRDRATSLEIESRGSVDRTELARATLRELDDLLAPSGRWSDEALASVWLERIGDIGQRVNVSCNGESFSGRVLDIHPDMGLLMQLDSGARRQFDLATISRC